MKKLLLTILLLTLTGCSNQEMFGATSEVEYTSINRTVKASNNINIGREILFETKIANNISDDKPILYIVGDKEISFTPEKIVWDTGEVIVDEKQSKINRKLAKVEEKTDATEIDGKSSNSDDAVIYEDAFMVGVDLGIITEDRLWRKVTKIDSLATLGEIPVGTETLEVWFEIETDFDIVWDKKTDFEITEDFRLGEDAFLNVAEVWDEDGNNVQIKSFLKKNLNSLYYVKEIPVSFLNTATFPIYTDADITVASSVDSFSDAENALWGPYWYDTSNAVIVYMDNASDMRYAYTSNGGTSWDNTLIYTGVSIAVASFYDQEVPDDTGTLLYITWLESGNAGSDTCKFVTLDISDNTLGTVRTVASGLTVSTGVASNRITMTKTVSGNIIVAFINQTENEFWISDDLFATSPTQGIGGFYDSATEEDYLILLPSITDDDDDCAGIYHDRNLTRFTLKMFDGGTGLISEFLVDDDVTTDATHYNVDGAIRHSDGHIIVAYHSNDDSTTDDLRVYDITPDSTLALTATQKTNVFTDRANTAQTAVFIDQSTDDIYVSYLGDGWVGSVNAYYKKSTDGGANWGSETQFNEGSADDFRLVQSGRTVLENGKYMISWYNDDTFTISTNTNNAILIGTAPTADDDAVFFGVNF